MEQKVMRKVVGRGSTKNCHQFGQILNVDNQYVTCAHFAEGGHFFWGTLPQYSYLGLQDCGHSHNVSMVRNEILQSGKIVKNAEEIP